MWTGSEMIVFGGCTNHDCSSQAGVGARYNPNIDNWTAMSSVNAPFPAPVSLRCGQVRDDHLGRLLGGECQITTNTGGRYNPSSNSWVATQSLPRRSSEIHSFLSGRARRC